MGRSVKDLVNPEKETLIPSAYYRSQHPDLFSDSDEVEKGALPRDAFAFSLDQLTTEKKEREFEDFARRLAEHEICPNLLPQTGPTGGGDSKTDSSTYPVSPELGERRWWVGHTAPVNEDWAFAFSCKHDWRSKVKDDIAKIAALPRRFSKAFFVTNQAVKDKSRAEVEDALRSQFKIDVRILDRIWIIDRVYTNKHEALAIGALGLQLGGDLEKRMGPNDARRQQELEVLLTNLRKGGVPNAGDYVLSQDYLVAGKLSSSLQRPRDETEGLFVRARDLAIKSGHLGSIIRTHYTHAWRAFFWFDDAKTAENNLEIILPWVPKIWDAELLECFVNLCSILETASITEFYPREENVFIRRREAVFLQLGKLVSDQGRPNNALYAETLITTSGGLSVRTDHKSMEKVFKKLLKIFRRAHGLNSYPIFRFMNTWESLGDIYCDWPGYRELQRGMQEITSKRYGESKAGHRQLKFGYQLLKKGLSSEALDELSSARFLLSKEETLGGSVEAALGCAGAYEEMGNLWASRSETIVAAQICLGSLERFHDYPSRGYHVAMRMAWIELQLGRLTPFLAWRNLATRLFQVMNSPDQDAALNREEIHIQDAALASLLIKSPKADVESLKRLAGTLDDMGLILSNWCLLDICGDGHLVKEDMNRNLGEVVEFQELVKRLKSQPIFNQVPERLRNGTEKSLKLSVSILDTLSFEILCGNSLGPQLIAENILGMLDAAFARAKVENFAIIHERITLEIVEDESGVNPPDLTKLMEGFMDPLQQVWKGSFPSWLINNRGLYGSYLSRFLKFFLFFSTIDPFEDVKKELDYWAKNGVFERALVSVHGSIALLDVLGKNSYDLDKWINASND